MAAFVAHCPTINVARTRFRSILVFSGRWPVKGTRRAGPTGNPPGSCRCERSVINFLYGVWPGSYKTPACDMKWVMSRQEKVATCRPKVVLEKGEVSGVSSFQLQGVKRKRCGWRDSSPLHASKGILAPAETPDGTVSNEGRRTHS